MSELLDALRFRYSDCPRDAILEVCTFREAFSVRTYRNTEENWHRIADEYDRAEYDVWSRISVLPESHERNKRGLELHTWGTTTLHVDIDPRLEEEETLEQWQQRKLAELEAFNPRPTRIEMSGRGFYAFWKLWDFTTNWVAAKQANKWLAVQLGGDDCYDVARILRLPNTLNPKPDGGWAKLIWTTTDTYHLDDFEGADLSPVEARAQTAPVQPEAIPSTFEHDVRERNPKLWARIESEATAMNVSAPLKNDGSARVRRHGNDMFVACELLRMKYTPGVVYSVLTHPTWFSGDKWREEGYHDSYPAITIARATALIRDEPLKTINDIADALIDEYEIMYHALQFWVYNDTRGVYTQGEHTLQMAIIALTGVKWTASLEDNVMKMVARRCRVDEVPRTQMVNTKNGMFHLYTHDLVPHRSSYKSVMQIDANWNPIVDTRAVDKFVDRLLPEEAIPVWWMFSGYCLMTDVPLEYRLLLVLSGGPRTGKSTLLGAQELFLGTENCSSVALTALGGDGDKFTTAKFVGKMLNVDSEANAEARLTQIRLLKALATGDPLDVEEKYKQGQRMQLPVKLAFGMNGIPRVTTVDEAFFGRWRIIPMRQDKPTFEPENPETKLRAERELMSIQVNRDAWLLRSIQGLAKLQKLGGFPEYGVLAKAKEEFRGESDAVTAFFQECTVPDVNARSWLKASELYKAYYQWMQDNGEERWVKSKSYVSRRAHDLAETGLLGPGVSATRSPQVALKGLRITYGYLTMGER